jgi:hypothetical protein
MKRRRHIRGSKRRSLTPEEEAMKKRLWQAGLIIGGRLVGGRIIGGRHRRRVTRKRAAKHVRTR